MKKEIKYFNFTGVFSSSLYKLDVDNITIIKDEVNPDLRIHFKKQSLGEAIKTFNGYCNRLTEDFYLWKTSSRILIGKVGSPNEAKIIKKFTRFSNEKIVY